MLCFSLMLACMGDANLSSSRAAPGAGEPSVALEALKRLKGIDVEANPAVKTALMRVLESVRGTGAFVELVRDFGIRGEEKALLDFALDHPEDEAAVEALRLVLAQEGEEKVGAVLNGSDSLRAQRAVGLLGNLSDAKAFAVLQAAADDPRRPLAVREAAVVALSRAQSGAVWLKNLAEADRLPADLQEAVGKALRQSRWEEIRKWAEAWRGSAADREPEALPPVGELLLRTGDPKRGAEVFFRAETACSTCHQVRGQGTDFGPKLSEIGTKLGKDALYTAILDPSAGISFGYEGWEFLLKNGQEAFGLIVSETDESVALKTQGGVVVEIPKSDILQRRQQQTSVMPAGLEQTMTAEELVHLVEFLHSLKKGVAGGG